MGKDFGPARYLVYYVCIYVCCNVYNTHENFFFYNNIYYLPPGLAYVALVSELLEFLKKVWWLPAVVTGICICHFALSQILNESTKISKN